MKYAVIFSLFLSSTCHSEVFINSLGQISGRPISIEITIDDDDSISGSYMFSMRYPGEPISVTGTLNDDQIFLESTDEAFEESFEGDVERYEGEILIVRGSWSSRRDFNFSRNAILQSKSVREFSFFGERNLLSDRHISCEEMALFPEIVFESRIVNLGSGSTARDSFDLDCNKSIGNLDFMQSILFLANEVRGDTSCKRGTIWGAKNRYYFFGLSKLGYLPEYDFEISDYLQNRARNNELHFQSWGMLSLRNHALYEQFLSESAKVEVLLADWYSRNHAISAEAATKATDAVLYGVKNRAYGSYPSGRSADAAIRDVLQQPDDLNAMVLLRRQLIAGEAIEPISDTLSMITEPIFKQRSETPLSLAAYDQEVLLALLEKGFDVNHMNSFGKTALYYAIENTQLDAVKLLVEYGANVDSAYNQENDFSQDNCGISHWNRSPLMHAAQHSDVEIVDYLVSRGANTTAQDSTGLAPRDYALRAGKTLIVEYLESIITQ